MADMDMLFKTVDMLNEDELSQLQDYIEKRRTTMKVWIIKPENLREMDEIMRPVQEEAAQMSEAEINQMFDQAIAEVRRERREKTSRD